MVRKFAGELPTAQRDAVALSLQGLQPTEIAGALSIRPGTARSNLFRGRRKIVDRIRSKYPRFVAELSEADGETVSAPAVGDRISPSQAHQECQDAS